MFKSFVSTNIRIYILDVSHTNSCTYTVSKASVIVLLYSLYNVGTDRGENTASNGSSIVARVSVIVGPCLPIRCLAMAVCSRFNVLPFNRLCHDILSSTED
jgi:hypothetical protein